MSETVILVKVDPVEIALKNVEMVRYFFDCTPATIVKLHHAHGFPIRWTGEGNGRRGYIPVREARAFAKRKAMNS